MPAIDYTERDLLYRPRNLRAHRAYGFSPVEQVIATVNIGLKRQLNQLAYYSEGNIPESLIGVPDAWTPDQIKNFQDYWDLYFTGDLARRRRAKFVPGGVAKTFIQTKEPELKNAFDEWIARVVCFAFSISPQPFVTQMNRATSETQKDSADEEGLLPILNWIKRLCDHVIQNFWARKIWNFPGARADDRPDRSARKSCRLCERRHDDAEARRRDHGRSASGRSDGGCADGDHGAGRCGAGRETRLRMDVEIKDSASSIQQTRTNVVRKIRS